jgi:hypothetical protein
LIPGQLAGRLHDLPASSADLLKIFQIVTIQD